MSDIFATPAAGTSRPVGGVAGETPVRLVDPSPEFSRLATGESLRGTVVGKDDHGHLLVRTRLGTMNLASLRALPVGTEVVLQVRSVGPQVILTLLPLDAAAGGAVQTTRPHPTTAPAQSTPNLPPDPADLVQRGQILRGLLQAAPPMPLLTGLPTAQPGTELLVRILSLGVQSPSPGTASLPAPAAAGPGGTAAAGQPVPGQAMAGQTISGPSIASPSIAGQTVSGQTLPGQAPPSGAAQNAAGGQAAAAPVGPGAKAQGATIPAASGPAAPAQIGPVPGLTSSQTPGQIPGQIPGQSPGVAAGTPAPPGQAASGSTAGLQGHLAAASPGLRLGPQAPVATSGHTLATALQSISAEAAAKAAGNLAPVTPPLTPGAAGSPAGATAGGATAAGLRVTGLVTATTSVGQPILHTPLGILTLNTQAALPLGTSLALEVALPAAAGPLTLQGFPAAWPSLETLEQALFSALPAAQMEAVARALPQIGPRLASGVMFFLSALNQGSIAGWLAPTTSAMRQSERSELGERLGRELAGLNRSIETPAGEWRFVNLPLWSEQGLRELRCFFRQQAQRDGERHDGEKATRFVLELELKQHGELQLDGLVRHRHFDLVLRSRRPLPAVVRGDLRVLFEEANAIGGYVGQLAFQTSRDWLPMLAAQSTANPHDGLTV